MTKRKTPSESLYSALERRLHTLRKIAVDLEDREELSDSARLFLVEALWQIGEGKDADAALGVIAKRGERRTREQAERAENAEFAMRHIASAIRPIAEDGLGLSLGEAIDNIASDMQGDGSSDESGFGLSADTLWKYWNENPHMRTPTFSRPLSSLPERRSKRNR